MWRNIVHILYNLVANLIPRENRYWAKLSAGLDVNQRYQIGSKNYGSGHSIF